ncbi:ABC transporter permease [Mesorhizobium australicum]|uniref:Peptide/nickel transport system permease protein n=1 Tax=Mesorhizobium australicum TaxID=536018 RepID=A0A1X7PL33_9HYPH|nr:ABC transporter permease [Mesorhizobium australicum]SMH51497.1 peptide/nickel transport system permease protein [Mesorhizobium australicum]
MTALRISGRCPRFNLVFGTTIVGLLFVLAAFGQFIAPYGPLDLDLPARLTGPSAQHLLGADEFGRDTLSRLLYGAQASAWIAFATLAFALSLGTAVGVVSGYFGGVVDRFIMMVNDALLAFPGLLLALGIMAIFGASSSGIVVALGIAYMPGVVRVVRGTVLSVRQLEFVEASVVMGNSHFTTMFRHVLPNSIPPITVLGSMMFGSIILSEAALSFLGLGVPPPDPSWGNMLATARPYIMQSPLLILLPGLCITITLLGINQFGDAVRDLVDPKMSGDN